MWPHRLRRALIVLLATLLAAGTLPQSLLSASAQPSCGTCLCLNGTSAAQGDADHSAAKPHHARTACPLAISCAAAPAAAIPDSVWFTSRVEWKAAIYVDVASRLRGRTIAPELTPPIAFA